MTETETRATEPAAAASADFTQTWRYKIGLAMIVGGNGVLVVGLLMPLLGAGAGIVGVMVVGGEVVSLASIVLLGKEGFNAIKAKAFAFVKGGFAAPVGPVRHYIGIALLCTNVVTTFTLAAYAWTAFDPAYAEGPAPAIWGLDFAQQGSLVFWLLLIGEASFLIAIYVLGAEWWGRFRSLFVWKG